MIYLGELINNLSKYLPKIISFECEDIILNDLQFIEKGQSYFKRNTLYLGYTSSLSSVKSLNNDASFILIENAPVNYDDFTLANNNIIVIPHYTDIFVLFNTIKAIFNRNQNLLHSSSKLLDELIYSNGIDSIIETASIILNNPIILLDNSYKIIGYSKSITTEDNIWVENVKKGYCSYEYISAVKTLEEFKNAPSDDKPFSVYCYTSDIKRMVTKVFVDDKQYGFFFSIESNSSFDNIEKETFTLISKVIAREIKFSKNAACQYSKMADSIFCDLIENNINNKFIYTERVKGTLFEKNSNYLLLSFDLSNYNNLNYKNERLKHSIEKILPSIYSVFYENKILALIDLKDKDYIPTEIIQEYEKFLKDNSLIVGVSNIFNSCYDLPLSYKHTNTSLYFSKIFKENKNIYYYEDYKFYHLLSCIDDCENLSQFCHVTAMQMAEYDRLNNTQYLDTLFEYIKGNKSITKASNNLFVHKNTVTYRLNKIKELFCIDFNNNSELFQIYYSYLIFNYKNKITNKCKETMN